MATTDLKISNSYRANWEKGCEEFNSLRFWHAHEAWEKGWLDLPVPVMRQIQGLIQGCAVFHHLNSNRQDPARKLCARALELLSEAQSLGLSSFSIIEVPGLFELLSEMNASRLKEEDNANWWTRVSKLKAKLQWRE